MNSRSKLLQTLNQDIEYKQEPSNIGFLISTHRLALFSSTTHRLAPALVGRADDRGQGHGVDAPGPQTRT